MHFELDQNPFLVTTPKRPEYALRSVEPSYSPQSSPRRSTRQRHSPYSPTTRIFSSLQQAQTSPNDNHPSSPEQRPIKQNLVRFKEEINSFVFNSHQLYGDLMARPQHNDGSKSPRVQPKQTMGNEKISS